MIKMTKLLHVLSFFYGSIAFATYSPQVIVTDPNGNTQGVNGSHEAQVVVNSDSNISKETGGNLALIYAKLLAGIPTTGTYWQSTQPVSLLSLPGFSSTPTFNLGLLGGASTNAAQVTAQASLTSIDSKLTSPLAVTGTFFQATQPVSGTFWQTTQPISAASLPLPTGAATSGNQVAAQTSLTSIDSKLTSPLTVTTGGLTDTQLRASAVPVSGTFFQATQPISGTITANSGSNLNTSALNLESTQSAFKTTNHTDLSLLALETGGHLASVDTKLTTINTTLGSPFQSGGSIGNSSFGISGTLPAYGVTPTFNLGTLNGANLETTQSAFKTANHADLAAINTTLGAAPMQNSGGSVTANLGTIGLAATAANQATAQTSLSAIQTSVSNIPASPATAGNQTTANTSLSTISTAQTSGGQKTQLVDGSGNVAGAFESINGVYRLPVINSGRGVVATFTQAYSSNLSTSSFTTIISSTASTINEEDIFDNSGGIWYLAYAATCGALSSSTTAIIVGPGGGDKGFQIPSGNCVGFEAIGSTISTGNVYMTFYK